MDPRLRRVAVSNMWDVAWGIVVVLVLALVAVVLLAGALLEKSFWARVGALLALGAGGAQGAEIGAPWLPLSLLIAAVAACLAGHARRRTTRGRPITGPERGRSRR